MKAATLVARLMLGLAFTVFGANFFFEFHSHAALAERLPRKALRRDEGIRAICCT